MMNGNELFKMYQAWMQGNENYVRDWQKFAEWAAEWNRTTTEKVMQELQKHYWFKKE
jgi:hypothetical protein